MTCMTRIVAAAVAAALLAAMPTAARPDPAKTCRMDGVPPGVRLPSRPGCKPPPDRVDPRAERLRPGSRPGFIDLGNGTEVRIGGSVSVETGYGH